MEETMITANQKHLNSTASECRRVRERIKILSERHRAMMACLTAELHEWEKANKSIQKLMKMEASTKSILKNAAKARKEKGENE
jgi:hypothetical protein